MAGFSPLSCGPLEEQCGILLPWSKYIQIVSGPGVHERKMEFGPLSPIYNSDSFSWGFYLPKASY